MRINVTGHSLGSVLTMNCQDSWHYPFDILGYYCRSVRAVCQTNRILSA